MWRLHTLCFGLCSRVTRDRLRGAFGARCVGVLLAVPRLGRSSSGNSDLAASSCWGAARNPRSADSRVPGRATPRPRAMASHAEPKNSSRVCESGSLRLMDPSLRLDLFHLFGAPWPGSFHTSCPEATHPSLPAMRAFPLGEAASAPRIVQLLSIVRQAVVERPQRPSVVSISRPLRHRAIDPGAGDERPGLFQVGPDGRRSAALTGAQGEIATSALGAPGGGNRQGRQREALQPVARTRPHSHRGAGRGGRNRGITETARADRP